MKNKELAKIISEDNFDLNRRINGFTFWLITSFILIIGLFVLLTIEYKTSVHYSCHNEVITSKIEMKSIDPGHNNPYGRISQSNYPNSKIVCETGVEEFPALGHYIGEVGKTCLITTTKKACEIK